MGMKIGDFKARPRPACCQAFHIQALIKRDAEPFIIDPDHARAQPVFLPDDERDVLPFKRPQPFYNIAAQAGFRKIAHSNRALRAIIVNTPRMQQH